MKKEIGFRTGRRIKMMTTHESDRFRSKITGSVYEVKKIVNQMVILETPDGASQVLTELNNIELFYEREWKQDGNRD
jgi:7,8-dihydro-6-hydroxymethylpterin-pyrophosphokinase